jgi:hypothetical protein
VCSLTLLATQLEADPTLEPFPGVRRNVVTYAKRLGALRLHPGLESSAVGLVLARLELALYVPQKKHASVNGAAVLVRLVESVARATRLLERAIGRQLPAWSGALNKQAVDALPAEAFELLGNAVLDRWMREEKEDDGQDEAGDSGVAHEPDDEANDNQPADAGDED